MGYKKVNTQGQFYKFAEEGQELEGKWLGVTTGKYGENGSVLDDAGNKQTFGLSAALKDLAMVPTGTRIKIVMTGHLKMKGGKQPMKTFDLFVEADGEDESAGVKTEATQAAATGADDILF